MAVVVFSAQWWELGEEESIIKDIHEFQERISPATMEYGRTVLYDMSPAKSIVTLTGKNVPPEDVKVTRDLCLAQTPEVTFIISPYEPTLAYSPVNTPYKYNSPNTYTKQQITGKVLSFYRRRTEGTHISEVRLTIRRTDLNVSQNAIGSLAL